MMVNPGVHGHLGSVGILLLRIGAGSMMVFGHGWGKLVGFGKMSEGFPSVMGIGSAPSLALAVFAELVCSALVVVGVATRFAALNVLITMLVAALLIHGDDPFATKELALAYATMFGALVFTGAGRYSIDARL
jgi:putative oxidoreductase